MLTALLVLYRLPLTLLQRIAAERLVRAGEGPLGAARTASRDISAPSFARRALEAFDAGHHKGQWHA